MAASSPQLDAPRHSHATGPTGRRQTTFNREFLKLRGPWRAALALALHIGFFAVPLALVIGVVAIGAFTIQYDLGSGMRALLAALVVAAVLGVGLRAVLATRVRPRGVVVSRSEQPQLWKLVDALSSAAGAPSPHELRITSEPGARVREDTALLGLRIRSRHLELGLPLLAALTVSELRALVARETSRAVGRSKLTATAQRIATSVEHTAAELTEGPTKWLFHGYARLNKALTSGLGDDLTLFGDATAVNLAGKRAAVTSARKTIAVELGWQDFAAEYLSMATDVEHTPDVVLGFRSFMEHADRKRRLAERAKQVIAEEPEEGEPGGGALTMRERVAAMKRLSDPGRDQDERPGFALFRNPKETIPRLEDRLMVDGLGPRLPWAELASMAGKSHVERQAGLLSSAMAQSGLEAQPAIGAVLAEIHRGRGADLVNPVLNPGLDPEQVPEAAVDTLTELLGDTVVDALICSGRAKHELDWGGPSTVRLGNGQPLDPDRLVRPAVADPRLVPGLHRVLVDLGVPLQHCRPPAEEAEPSLTGIVSPVRFSSKPHDLLVTDRGLLLLPSAVTTTQRLLAGAFARARRAELEQISQLETTAVNELRERSGAQWVDSSDVAEARLTQGSSSWSLALDLYLDDRSVSSLDPDSYTRDGDDVALIEVFSASDSEERGDPYRGLGELMGARMRIDDQLSSSEE